jgi:hypothetical protein
MSLPESFYSENDLRAVGPYDVLSGRDKRSFRNVGNRRFRVTVSLYLTRYMEAETKSEKSRVIASVVDSVRASGGRFLKWSTKRQEWAELDDKHTREKVGHALRDTAVAKMSQSSITAFAAAASFTSTSPLQTKARRNVAGEVDPLDCPSDPLPLQQARRLHRPSQKLSMHLSPAEIQDIFTGPEADQDDDDDAMRLPRLSFSSVASMPTTSPRARLRSFESDKLILNLDEVEQLMAAEESASVVGRGKWDDVFF